MRHLPTDKVQSIGFGAEYAGERIAAALADYDNDTALAALVFAEPAIPAVFCSIRRPYMAAEKSAVEKLRHDKIVVLVSGIQPQPMSALFKSGVVDLIGIENFCGNIDEALRKSTEIVSGCAV